MSFELITDILSIILNLAGLMLCLFLFFEHTRRTLTLAILFFLGNLLSNYYWGVYELIMGDYPNVSSVLAYLGWNVAFAMLTVMLFERRREKGIRSISPFAFIPVVLNVPQLLIYLQYGGYFNNIWQVFWTTAGACLAFDGIISYAKDKSEQKRFPYVDVAVIAYILFEYISWTASCYAWPSEVLNPYVYAIALSGVCYILIPFAFSREYGDTVIQTKSISNRRLMKMFRPLYIVVVVVCCVGGYFLALWTRDTLDNGVSLAEGSDPYRIIAVLLFIVSVIIVSFTVMIILVVSSGQKSFEAEESEAAKRLAVRANEAKSEFLANMSHEIRTPINAVLGMNEMILRESLQARDDLPEARDEIKSVFSEICNFSGNIDSAGKSLLSIINDILDFSKIEAGKLEIVDNDYQLSSILNDVSNMIVFKAKSKGLEYDVDVDESIPDILRGDEIRIRQIVTNLLNNAVKYTEKGKVVLSVSEKKIEDASGDDITSLIISVKDTGMGIKEEDKDRLFKKFERMDLEKNSTIEGTGLGLAITGSLIDMMGGTVEVDTEYGKGSTFTAVIPQKVISEEAIGDFREKFKKSISEMKAEKEPFKAENATILVVDDTPMNLMVVKGLLKDTKINIETASGGEESIRMCSEKKYDLILMDQRMPEMDGITAMHRIRQDVRGMNVSTPCICLTADAVAGAKDRYISEGFDDYLTKPIDSKDLNRKLMDFIPKDKVQLSGDGSGMNTSVPETEKAKRTPLVDREEGIKLSGGNESLYEMLLTEFKDEAEHKIKLLDKCYTEKDWETYGAYIHSVKSTSKMIGAFRLSELAAKLEQAADNGRTEIIDRDHDFMRRMVRDVIDYIREM